MLRKKLKNEAPCNSATKDVMKAQIFFKKNIGNETATSEFGLMLDPMVRRKLRTGQSPLRVLNRG